MTFGCRRLITYENVEALKPGANSSVTAAPPMTGRRSSTSVFLPALARYAPQVRPLCPPPMMMASYRTAATDEPCADELRHDRLAMPTGHTGHHVALVNRRVGERGKPFRGVTYERLDDLEIPSGHEVQLGHRDAPSGTVTGGWLPTVASVPVRPKMREHISFAWAMIEKRLGMRI